MDRLCIAAVILALLLTAVLMNGEAFGVQAASTAMGYETRLFDTSRVHTIHIVMDDWEGFIEGCEDEEYAVCSVVIDGENYDNVGLRAKGNTSLSNVSSMGSDRYSFKLEFDQYDNTKSYYGLDKLSLNNLIQDNTMMKDYLTYRMMGAFGVAAPLCSYVYVTVNGEDWGLYLAVEAVEDAFLRRNYGTDHGELYKPDSLSMGGGRGNGRGFDMADFARSGGDPVAAAENENPFTVFGASGGRGQKFTAGAEEGADPGGSRGGGSKPAAGGAAGGGMPDMGGRGGMGGMGSSDVKLQYSDDDPASYANIFGNAKTDITQADQTRLIAALKTLSEGKNIENAVAVEDVIRYFVVHNFVVNGDSYTGSMIHNYYLYEEDGRLSMIPWDYNLAFGTFQGGSASGAVNDPIDSPVSGSMEDRPMIAWIFADETYTALYHQYFRAFLETVDAAAMAAETAVLIAPYVERDPTKFCTTEEFMAGVSALQRFCLLRAESVSGQLDGTVPATDALQSASPDALVDTGDLNLSDMGNMSMGGGFGGRGDRETGTGGWQGGMQAPDGMQITDGMQVSGGVQRPGFGDITAVPGQVPGGSAAGVPLGTVDSGGSGEAALLAVSAVLLAAGLLLAWKYPRRRMCR